MINLLVDVISSWKNSFCKCKNLEQQLDTNAVRDASRLWGLLKATWQLKQKVISLSTVISPSEQKSYIKWPNSIRLKVKIYQNCYIYQKFLLQVKTSTRTVTYIKSFFSKSKLLRKIDKMWGPWWSIEYFDTSSISSSLHSGDWLLLV